jgi:hypothetical protein
MSARSLRVRELAGPLLTSDLILDPSSQIFRSLAVAQCIGVLSRLGVLAELSVTAVTAVLVEALAQRLGIAAQPLRLMLDVLTQERLLDSDASGYTISPDALAQLDPDSPMSVTALLSFMNDNWALWSDLEFVARGGPTAAGLPAADDEAGWYRRVRGQYEYARRVGTKVVEKLRLPASARSVVDVGGSHGWFSEALCRQHPMLRATVMTRRPRSRSVANSCGKPAWKTCSSIVKATF